jgi:hypothetical protein
LRQIVDSLIGNMIAGVFAAVALGLLTAAAVVALKPLVSTAGALGIVGGVHLLIALIVLLWMRGRRRRYLPSPNARNAQLGAIVGGFLAGAMEGLIRPRNRG